MSHKHDFSALWWHFGPFGRQDVHLHPCATPSCPMELVALGRNCDPKAEHVARRLTHTSRWSDKSNEGAKP